MVNMLISELKFMCYQDSMLPCSIFVLALLWYICNVSDEEIYGDFEDLETGEVTTGEDGPSGYNSDDSISDDAAENENDDVADGTGGEKTSAEKRADKKRKMKEMFNTDYDDEKGYHYHRVTIMFKK